MSEGIFGIYQTDEEVLIHNLVTNQIISIDRSYVSIALKEISILNQLVITKVVKSHGIIGIIQVGFLDFLLYITSSLQVGNIGNTEIEEIKDVDMILISMENSKLSYEISFIRTGLKNLFQQGFYFSRNYDLTTTIQEQKNIKLKQNNQYNVILNSNKAFLWNLNICSKFLDYGIDSDFIVNCIYGYVCIFSEKLPDLTNLHYILISRRQVHNAGIKIYKRGIDINGNCANHVETESIVINNKNLFSYVQVRGTAPVDYKLGKNINTSESMKIFDKHIQAVCTKYKMLFIVNLMNNSKQNETLLTEKYETYIRMMNYKNVKYMYFDYDNEVNLDPSVHAIGNFLTKIESLFTAFKFFGIYYNTQKVQQQLINFDSNNTASMQNQPDFEEKKKKTIIDQVGIIRTSCFDGLSRTNAMQMRIAWKALLLQLTYINIDGVFLFGNDFTNEDKSSINTLAYMNTGSHNSYDVIEDIIYRNQPQIQSINNGNPNSKSDFLQKFQAAWKENNLRLSLQYNGHSTSVIDNEEQFQQRCIDILLQKSLLNNKNGK